VTDGDTLTVRLADGSRQPVRLIGVDAPEGGQPFAPEAAALLARLAADRVCLENDITDRDRFNRLLRYAWTQDGVLINEALVAAGLATVVTFPPDVKHLESRYLPAETGARAAGLGIWAAAASSQAPSPAASGECDPSYPDVCIPPPSKVGDLDCGHIPYRRFRVLPPDPHRFDSDRDGIGCER
jgi:micrococcal nuclease